MGYSARYHAASLIAVFLALAIGILIGVGLGGNVLSDTEKSLRESLEGDIEEAQADAAEAQEALGRELAFSSRAYPVLVGDVLARRRIGLIALGGLPDDLEGDVMEALEPTGGELVEVSVVQLPPDGAALAEAAGRPFARAARDDERLELLATRLGRQVVRGRGALLERTREELFSRSSGEGGPLRGVVLARASLGDADDEPTTDAFITGFAEGISGGRAPAVAVERSDSSESFVSFFEQLDVATVDNLDLTSGKVSMVFALTGAKGNFGIKETADSLLPELLAPARRGPG